MVIALELTRLSNQVKLVADFEQFIATLLATPELSPERTLNGIQLFGNYAHLTTLCNAFIERCLAQHPEASFLIKLAGSAHCLPASFREEPIHG